MTHSPLELNCQSPSIQLATDFRFMVHEHNLLRFKNTLLRRQLIQFFNLIAFIRLEMFLANDVFHSSHLWVGSDNVILSRIV